MSAELQLKKDQERRLRAGHCWVYSNEVDTDRTPLKGLEPGEPVALVSHRGQWLGWGYANPHSLICARLVSRDRAHPLDRSLLVHRFKIALGLRERLYADPYYRLVFGEADGLPGLVVDRYGELLVVQITTAGMERQREAIVEALHKVLRPQAILLRNDSPARELEGLELYNEEVLGTLPAQAEVREGGLSFGVSLLEGQKTGWFFDQAANRGRLLKYVAGQRVLDVCSYVGGWGVRAAAAGAAAVTCVDASQRALDAVLENAARNGVGDRVQVHRGDAFVALKDLKAQGERYDLVVLDPPAFIKRKKDLKEGTLAYRRLNEAALSVLQRDGLLVTASCSFHMDRDSLLRVVQQAGRHLDRSLQLLEQGEQGPDHPIHPAIPETSYLKAFYLRVLPSF
ncbi:MAG: rRNA (cytosine1962-C5)-methyltransferase [Pseudomonadota bacterium]|jgi:23S rRNA (cytosine1962-C5)-methyltransferase